MVQRIASIGDVMEVTETEGCCSLLNLRYFDSFTTKEQIIRELERYYEEFSEYENSSEFPVAMFATTKSTQRQAEEALKALKFKATKFKSRHAVGNEKILTHWFRKTPPTEMAQWVRNLKRKVKRDLRNN